MVAEVSLEISKESILVHDRKAFPVRPYVSWSDIARDESETSGGTRKQLSVAERDKFSRLDRRSTGDVIFVLAAVPRHARDSFPSL